MLEFRCYQDVYVDRVSKITSRRINDASLRQLRYLQMFYVILTTNEGAERCEQQVTFPAILIAVDILCRLGSDVVVLITTIDLETVIKCTSQLTRTVLGIDRRDDGTVCKQIFFGVVFLDHFQAGCLGKSSAHRLGTQIVPCRHRYDGLNHCRIGVLGEGHDLEHLEKRQT